MLLVLLRVSLLVLLRVLLLVLLLALLLALMRVLVPALVRALVRVLVLALVRAVVGAGGRRVWKEWWGRWLPWLLVHASRGLLGQCVHLAFVEVLQVGLWVVVCSCP